MIGLTAAALLLVVVQYGSFNPDPLNDLTINFNIKDSPRAFADKEFEAEDDEPDPHPVIIGGEGSNKEDLKDLEVFDGEWKPFPPEMPENRGQMAAVTFEKKLYVVGGLQSNLEPVSPVGLFTMREENGEWTALPELKHKRYLHTATVLNEGQELVVTGGYGDVSISDVALSTEVYKLGPNPSTEWLTDPDWNMKVTHIEHAAIQYRGHFYVIGGRSVKGKGVIGMQTVEVFNDRKWQLLSKKKKLNQKRYGHGAETIDDDRVHGFGYVIAVCGGKYRENSATDETYLRSCETFNGDKWDVNNIGDMNIARANFGFMFYGGRLWAFGGYSKDEVLSSVEFYAEKSPSDPSLIWKNDVLNPLKKARAYFGVTKYSFPKPPSKNQPATRLEQANIVNSTFI